MRDEMVACLSGYDALLTPTAPTPAYRLGEKTSDPLAMYKVRGIMEVWGMMPTDGRAQGVGDKMWVTLRTVTSGPGAVDEGCGRRSACRVRPRLLPLDEFTILLPHRTRMSDLS